MDVIVGAMIIHYNDSLRFTCAMHIRGADLNSASLLVSTTQKLGATELGIHEHNWYMYLEL